MDTLVIACQMLEHEVRAAMAVAGLDCPVCWVERELHNTPPKLREELQRLLDEATAHTVLLAFTQCGNAAAGLVARNSRLVLPRFADCVHLLLSAAPGDPGAVDMRTLYTFRGFLESRGGLWRDYDHCAARYGPEKAQRMCRLMVKHYRALSLMDTGVGDPAASESAAQALAQMLGLSYETCAGCNRVMEKLFSGVWDEEFILIPQGGVLDEGYFQVVGAPATGFIQNS